MRQEQVVLQVKRLTKENVNFRRKRLPDTDISVLKQSLLKNRLLTYLFIVCQEGRIQCHTITRYTKLH